MTSKYSVPSIEAIQEDSSEDELEKPLRGKDDGSASETQHRQYRSSHHALMSPPKANTSKERERSRRRHKSAAGSSKHESKSKPKATSTRRTSAVSSRDIASDTSRSRHRRSHSSRDRDSSSTGSSSDEEQPIQDHRAVLAAARARLTSPSTISTFTSLTTTTNKSSSSSGSNSTVTQASITKRPSIEKNTEIPETPMSPAVPDAPDVFAFLEDDPPRTVAKDDEKKDQEKDDESEEDSSDEDDADATPQWPPAADYVGSSLPPHISQTASTSSSASSFHGEDNFSEPPAEADNDTDRSTSPERSVQGQEDEHETPPAPPPADETSTKIALQMAAAQQRQNLHGSMHSFGTPNMQRGPANLPHVPSTALSSRYQQPAKHRPLPRAEKLPITGYELLASQLSSHTNNVDGGKIKPMYRKFEALNHRLLLHLQDEISELEEQLHRLDNADTQTRRTDRHIIPASRRAAAAAGGELQWHKTDVLGRIGYKLAQYNQALASFNTTQSLSPPDPEDISTYRDYLHTAHLIAEAETRFLDPADDLVSIASDHIPPSSSYPSSNQSSASSYPPSTAGTSTVMPSSKPSASSPEEVRSTLPALAVAIAVAILIPILTFSVIPGFVGRVTVSSLVSCGVLGALIQGSVIDQSMLLRSEGLMCAGIYGGVMIVVAGVMPG
ncbi:hypothetical protein LSUE1_G004780 [Lachnellula suecica]|uniref:DUF6594 domain-containing protein n=1 Tax=Lachnellula suecica TaxID=602035 RepID=A0A8T9CCN5_9HELO|nr:hypothetical protein LSUE1_G004780 [Lachnellula suecica]